MAIGKTSIKAVKKEQDRLSSQQEGGGSDIKWFKMKDGENYLRVLPPWSTEVEQPYYLCGIHYGLPHPKDASKQTAYGCLMDHGKECPICEEVKELYATKEDDNIERAKKISRKTRVYYNVIDISEPDKGVQIFGAGTKIHEEIVDAFIDIGAIDDLDAGYNIKIIKKYDPTKGSKIFGTSYKVKVDREPTKVAKALREMIEEQIMDLTTVLPQPSADDILASLGKKKPAAKAPETKSKVKMFDDEPAEWTKPSKKAVEVEEDTEEEVKPRKRPVVEEEVVAKKKVIKPVVKDDDSELEKELADMDSKNDDFEGWDKDEDEE